MHKRDLSLNRAITSGVLEKMLSRVPVGSIDELYASLGYGKLEARQVFRQSPAVRVAWLRPHRAIRHHARDHRPV